MTEQERDDVVTLGFSEATWTQPELLEDADYPLYRSWVLDGQLSNLLHRAWDTSTMTLSLWKVSQILNMKSLAELGIHFLESGSPSLVYATFC